MGALAYATFEKRPWPGRLLGGLMPWPELERGSPAGGGSVLDEQAGAADAEHVAIELDVTDDIAAHHLPLRLVLAHGAALPQLPEPVARRQQFLDQGLHPAIAGVPAVNPAEVGHERRLEGAGIARPADDPSLAVAQGRPGEV